jgi:hypothetical protein
MNRRLLRLLRLLPFAAAILAACDSDDHVAWKFSSNHTVDQNPNGGTRNGAQGGLVIIYVHDGPLDDLAAFRVTFSELRLLGSGPGGAEAVIYRSSSGRRVDLRALEAVPAGTRHEVLAVARGVRPGAYERIALELRDPELILKSGAALAGGDVALAGGGRIEIELPEPQILEPGGAMVLALDVDLELTLAPGAWGDRPLSIEPVVLPAVIGGEPRSSLIAPSDVAGTVASARRRPGGVDVRLRLDGARGAIDAFLAGTAPDEVRRGSRLVLRGHLGREGRLRDAVAAAPEGQGDPEPPAVEGRVIAIDAGEAPFHLLGPETRRMPRGGEPFEIEELLPGDRVRVYPGAGGSGDAAGVGLAASIASGEIEEVDAASGAVVIRAGGERVRAAVAAGARLWLKQSSGGAMRLRPIGFDELRPGAAVTARVEDSGGAVRDLVLEER